MRILVTGCLGFIGSYFIRYLKQIEKEVTIIGLTNLSNTKNMSRLKYPEYEIETLFKDISKDLFEVMEGIDVVINFAAKTFVDSSIKDPKPFIETNVLGVINLLEQAKIYRPKLFVQISTDEVYGSSKDLEEKKEIDSLNPMNPYSASKAAAEMLVLSYHNTYGIPYIITRTENNYGPYQHLQKVIPRFVRNALREEKLPVYGDGMHERMWLHVEDHCSAIWHLIKLHQKKKIDSGTYNIGASQKLKNLELAELILEVLNKPNELISFVDDSTIRPGHDNRYSISSQKLLDTGWAPKLSNRETLVETINWYKENQEWIR